MDTIRTAELTLYRAASNLSVGQEQLSDDGLFTPVDDPANALYNEPAGAYLPSIDTALAAS
jgi:hypothetical protein